MKRIGKVSKMCSVTALELEEVINKELELEDWYTIQSSYECGNDTTIVITPGKYTKDDAAKVKEIKEMMHLSWQSSFPSILNYLVHKKIIPNQQYLVLISW